MKKKGSIPTLWEPEIRTQKKEKHEKQRGSSPTQGCIVSATPNIKMFNPKNTITLKPYTLKHKKKT